MPPDPYAASPAVQRALAALQDGVNQASVAVLEELIKQSPDSPLAQASQQVLAVQGALQPPSAGAASPAEPAPVQQASGLQRTGEQLPPAATSPPTERLDHEQAYEYIRRGWDNG